MVRWSCLIHCEYLSFTSSSFDKSSNSALSFGSVAYLYRNQKNKRERGEGEKILS
jgi:hypothetical protein